MTDAERATRAILAAKDEILAKADRAVPGLVARGGGARDLEVRTLGQPVGRDDRRARHRRLPRRDGREPRSTRSPRRSPIGSRARRTGASGCASSRTSATSAACAFAAASRPTMLATDDMDGQAVIDGIVNASRFAELDPYRAATHNKGIMNGVDAVVIATGNDWRAVEAGAHAFAARSGQYSPLVDLASRRRRARGLPRDAARARHRRRHAPRAPERASLAADRGRRGRAAISRRSPRRSASRRTSRRCARSRPTASSAVTWRCTLAPSRSRPAQRAARSRALRRSSSRRVTSRSRQLAVRLRSFGPMALREGALARMDSTAARVKQATKRVEERQSSRAVEG